MQILRKYQLDIIFLFFSIMIIVWSFFYILKYLGADPHDYEWFVVGPLVLFYLAFLWKIRGRIALADRRQVTAKTLIYWIVFGVTLILSYDSPISVGEYWSINLMFIVFSLFLADSYWDFKKLSLRSFWDKSETKI